MESHKIDIFLLQEMQLTGDFIRITNNYHSINHSMSKALLSRGQRGVAIILSPTVAKAYKDARSAPLTILSSYQSIITSNRAILLSLNSKGALFNTKRVFRKNSMKHINIKKNVASLYYPCKANEYDDFIKFSQDFLNFLDKNTIQLVG